jgi:predicted esterase
MPAGDGEGRAAAQEGELRARPGDPFTGAPDSATGLLPLNQPGGRDALLYVPRSYRARSPAPLLLMLHGAGGTARHGIDLARAHADRLGFILLAPTSAGSTWDIISGRRFGPDVVAVDRLLERLFADYAVNPARVAVVGFSDGASYALSLGLMNGRLFRRIIAFSPGFAAPVRQEGRPPIFISHGVADQVLPIDVCSRRLVPRLRAGGYDVDYVEFPGGHTIPERIAASALDAFAG